MRNAARYIGPLRIEKAEDHAVGYRSNCGRGGIRATSQTPTTLTFRLGLGVAIRCDSQARGSKDRGTKQCNF